MAYGTLTFHAGTKDVEPGNVIELVACTTSLNDQSFDFTNPTAQ